MKKFVIISIALFVLSGCNDKNDDKNDDKKECDAKGAGWLWDEVNKNCNAPVTSTTSIEAEACKAKGENWAWNETSKQCNPVVEYMTITVPDTDAVTILDDNGVGRELRVRVGFSTNPVVYYVLSRVIYGECIKVHKSHVPKISINLVGTGYYKYLDVLCSSTPGPMEVSPCVVGNYGFVKVRDRSDMFALEPLSGVDVDSCRELSPE